MTTDPGQSAPAPGGASNPLDETQRVEVPRFAPTPDPRPDTRWAWATPEPRQAASTWSAAPSSTGPATTPAWAAPRPAPPEPVADAARASQGWAAPASSATATWAAEPAREPVGTPAWSVAPTPVVPAARPRSGPGVGTVAAVALVAAILASSGTALALNASGALNPPSAPTSVGTSGQPSGGSGSATAGAAGDDSAIVIGSAAKLSPSVVKITVTGASSDPFSSGQTEGIGSGIVYDPNGWIITNHHVVTGADSLTVELKDGRKFSGTVYGIDTLTDLAIVKVDASGLPAATLGSSSALKVGQLVVAVGSPLGTYSFSVTSGIVSGKGQTVTVGNGATLSNLIDTDAAINPGNSGGPLADADGNVVGINTAVNTSDGIGYAIPIDIAKPIMAQAVRGEKLVRPWIGIRYETINGQVKAAQKLSVDNGALIINDSTNGGSAIQSGSPAEAAGLKDGDIVTAINGITVDQEHPLNLLLVQFAPGDTVKLTILRDGQTLTVPLTLGTRPDNLQ